MPNSIKTNQLTELVALRAAQVAPYFTLGSKAYFSDQLVGKRNGQTYKYILRDAGNVANSTTMDNTKNDIQEREVALTLEPWNIGVKTGAIEGKTDLIFDKEVAEPNGQKLINGAIAKSIVKDIPKCSTAWVASSASFEPLSQASAHLSSVTSEALYGFVDPMIEAIVTSKGAQFVPVDAPAMYRQGLIGHFHGADYRAQRFLKTLSIPAALVTAIEGATATAINSAKDTITITLASNTTSAFKIKAGTPFYIDGVVACDGVGDQTGSAYAFIASEDISVASGVGTISLKIDPVVVAIGGTRDCSMEDGSVMSLADAPAISCPDAGVYYMGLVRANGCFEFETLNEIDVAEADSQKGSVEGITIFQNRVIDLEHMTNTTRFDLVTLSGVVDKRYQAMVLVKKA